MNIFATKIIFKMLRSYFKCEAKILLSAKSCLLFFFEKKFKNRFQNSQLFIVRMKNDATGESKMLSWTLKIGVTYIILQKKNCFFVRHIES